MNTNSRKTKNNKNRRGLLRWWWMVPALALVAVSLIFVAVGAGGGSGERIPESELFAARHGPLTISVAAEGTFRGADTITLRNEVEGRTTILHIVDEGEMVEEGDLLVELDDSDLRDRLLDQEIQVEQAESNFINAREAVSITEQQGRSDRQAARVDLELALLDLEEFSGVDLRKELAIDTDASTDEIMLALEGRNLHALVAEAGTIHVHPGTDEIPGETDELLPEEELVPEEDPLADEEELEETLDQLMTHLEGQYKLDLQRALNNLTLARAEYGRAVEYLEGSRRLAAEEYISEGDLRSDELDAERRRLEVEVAENELRLLMRFTYRRRIAELVSQVEQRLFAVTKARHEGESALVDAKAQLRSRDLTFQREKDRLEQIRDQIEKCRIYAPSSGMVVHATTTRRGSREPYEVGSEVSQREEIIELSRGDAMMADISVHESALDKIASGMEVVLTTDSLPGRTYYGTVTRIAIMPDPQSRWLNPDLKLYQTSVRIEGNTLGLRPGMSCTAEIIVEEHNEVIHVPVQTVLRVDGKPTVFVPGPNGERIPRPIETGLDNNRMVHVKSGLEPGERVLLTPPMEMAERPSGRAREMPAEEANGDRSAIEGNAANERQTRGENRGGESASSAD